jgi:hypothetical protein
MSIPLEQLRIDSPCPADFDAMQGTGPTRFCTHCNKHVHDLSAMTRADAERLVCEAAGSLCVRFARDEVSGQVLTLGYAPAPRQRRWPLWAALVTAIASIAAAIGYYRRPAPSPPAPIMGAMLVPAPSVTQGRSISSPSIQGEIDLRSNQAKSEAD